MELVHMKGSVEGGWCHPFVCVTSPAPSVGLARTRALLVNTFPVVTHLQLYEAGLGHWEQLTAAAYPG